IADLVGIERPGAAKLEQADAAARCFFLFGAELAQRLAHVEIALAGSGDADPRRAAALEDHAVEAVGAHECAGGGALEIMQALFLAELIQFDADPEAARRELEIRDPDLVAVEASIDRRGRFDAVLDAFHRRPGAGIARQRIALEAEIDQFLYPGRIENRDHRVDEYRLRRVGIGRALGGMIVTEQGEHAAMGRGAGQIGMAQYVAGAVDAGALAVPKAEGAVMETLTEQAGLLRSPDRRRRQFLVETGLEADVAFGEMLLCMPELLVEATNRRAAISRNESGSVEPGATIELAAHQQHADDGLGTGEEDPLPREIESIVERDVADGHAPVFGHRPISILIEPILRNTLRQ